MMLCACYCRVLNDPSGRPTSVALWFGGRVSMPFVRGSVEVVAVMTAHFAGCSLALVPTQMASAIP